MYTTSIPKRGSFSSVAILVTNEKVHSPFNHIRQALCEVGLLSDGPNLDLILIKGEVFFNQANMLRILSFSAIKASNQPPSKKGATKIECSEPKMVHAPNSLFVPLCKPKTISIALCAQYPHPSSHTSWEKLNKQPSVTSVPPSPNVDSVLRIVFRAICD